MLTTGEHTPKTGRLVAMAQETHSVLSKTGRDYFELKKRSVKPNLMATGGKMQELLRIIQNPIVIQ
jgi:hypothetical protein